MIGVIKVHDLPTILQHLDDIRAEHLRALIRAATPHAVVQDAQTGQRYIPTVVGHRIELVPCAEPAPPA